MLKKRIKIGWEATYFFLLQREIFSRTALYVRVILRLMTRSYHKDKGLFLCSFIFMFSALFKTDKISHDCAGRHHGFSFYCL